MGCAGAGCERGTDGGVERRLSIAGRSGAEQVELAQKWESLDCTHVSLNAMGARLDSPVAHLEVMRAFAAAWNG